MFKSIRKTHPYIKIINDRLIDLPAPNNISIWWNFGSLIGVCLGIQLISGLFLAIHYVPDISLAFSSVYHITNDVNYGWILRNLHANGASIFFLCIYVHIGRGIYYQSYYIIETWTIGVTLFILTIATAFIGYVLPWGQMRFWAATVITNLLSAIPYAGNELVEWVWGGFAVDNSTLVRFYSFHFLLPFVISGVTIIHILFLHQTGSNNPLGISRNANKIPIHIYYTFKDLIGFFFLFVFLTYIILWNPSLWTEPENYIPANSLVTPIHIKPEWYFLWLYAILRRIPNKLGGVIAIFMALLILYLLPIFPHSYHISFSFSPFQQINFWIIVRSILILTWIGGCPVEAPYELIGQVFTFIYFFSVLCVIPILSSTTNFLYK